jgi:hypothetical protein
MMPADPDADEARPVHALGFVMTLIVLVAVCWLALGVLAVTGTIDVVVALGLGAAGYAAAAALAFVTSH